MAALLQNIFRMQGPLGRAYSFFSVTMIVSSFGLMFLEFFSTLREFTVLVYAFELVFTIYFSLEFVCKALLSRNVFAYLCSREGLIDILAIMPFFLNITIFESAHILHLNKLVRILKLAQYHPEFDEQELRNLLAMAPEEKIEYKIYRHPFFVVGLLLIPLFFFFLGFFLLSFRSSFLLEKILIAAIFFVFSFLFIYKIWMDFIYDMIVVTDQRLIIQNKHFIGRDVDHIRFEAVTNVTNSYAGILGVLFRYGNIVIETQATKQGYYKMEFIKAHEESARSILSHLR